MTGIHVLLFLFYVLVISILIRKSSQFSHAVISKNIFVGIFFLRILAGISYGYIYSRPEYLVHSDTWHIFRASLKQYQLLLHNPLEFIKTSFVFEGDISFTNFTQTNSSYWNILKEVLIIKFEALLNFFSYGNYYINALLFGFLIMAGSSAFFRVLERYFPSRPYLNLFSAFLVPSTMFWTSAVYKDGILLALMFVMLRQTQKWLDREQGNVRYSLLMLLSLIGIFFLRTYCALLIVPALTAWIVSVRFKLKAWKVFGAVYALSFAAIIVSGWLLPEMNPLRILSSWQNAFMKHSANSALPSQSLDPNLFGLIKNFPQSVDFAFLRPLLWENKGLQYLPFAVELFILQCLIFYALFSKGKWNAVAICALALGISGLLFLGYTVNIIGAIVRYRSIYMPFLFAAVLSTIPLESINRIGRFRRNQ